MQLRKIKLQYGLYLTFCVTTLFGVLFCFLIARSSDGPRRMGVVSSDVTLLADGALLDSFDVTIYGEPKTNVFVVVIDRTMYLKSNNEVRHKHQFLVDTRIKSDWRKAVNFLRENDIAFSNKLIVVACSIGDSNRPKFAAVPDSALRFSGGRWSGDHKGLLDMWMLVNADENSKGLSSFDKSLTLKAVEEQIERIKLGH